MIDVGKEITKLGGKKDRLTVQLEKIQADMAKPDYSNKVPEEIQKQNTEKVSRMNHGVCIGMKKQEFLDWLHIFWEILLKKRISEISADWQKI